MVLSHMSGPLFVEQFTFANNAEVSIIGLYF